MNEAFQEYINRTIKIRTLSSPYLKDIDNSDEYAERLRENFKTIGILAKENRDFLDAFFYPRMGEESALKENDIGQLSSFSDLLINIEAGESLDLPIVSMISDKLISHAKEKGDVYQEIRQKDVQIGVIYDLMNMTLRLIDYPEIAIHYREIGFKIGNYYFELLKKENFQKIEDEECREIIITNARFSIVFYEGISNNPEKNQEQLEKLAFVEQLENDEFYRKLLPHYEWPYHRFRVLQYYSMATEKQNAAGFTKEQICLICKKTEALWELFDSNSQYYLDNMQSGENKAFVDLYLAHNWFLAGKIEKEAYIKTITEIYNEADRKDYCFSASYTNLQIPLELLLLIDKTHYSMKEQVLFQKIYQNLLAYAFHMATRECITPILEYYCNILNRFIEEPSSDTFEQMVLKLLSAFHPPTYVHSNMVGLITECLCRHLINLKPEILIGVLDCKTVEQVREKYIEIVNFAYHSALCHDFGKITIIDTIFVYGRKLLDMEFDLIKTHPLTGYNMLKKYSSTRQYAEVALGHHKWYDNSKGYPESFDTSKSPVKPVIDLVLCADSLDAATDTIGRSYNRGKQLEEFIDELKEGSGTHYAPWLLDLFADEGVRKDIEFILTNSRKQNYRDTFFLLRNMQENDI